MAAYACVFVQGHGRFGIYDAETPVMLRFGQLSADEYFISEKAANTGVVIVNTSGFEDIAMLKHFANNDPEPPI